MDSGKASTTALDVDRAINDLTVDDAPLRSIHHFACTGGTLVSRCIAIMPNVQFLSEIAPNSSLVNAGPSGFRPTDLILTLRNSSRGSTTDLEQAVFLGGLRPIVEDCRRRGQHLVLREHNHSSYCTGQSADVSTSLLSILGPVYDLRSVVTVRHPLDSYLSLRNNGWLHFEPATLETYAARYHQFLDDHAALPQFRYEDLVATPVATVEALCDALELEFYPAFESLLGAHRLSGDSGRRGNTISPRRRRSVPPEIADAAVSSEAYRALCQRLGYGP